MKALNCHPNSSKTWYIVHTPHYVWWPPSDSNLTPFFSLCPTLHLLAICLYPWKPDSYPHLFLSTLQLFNKLPLPGSSKRMLGGLSDLWRGKRISYGNGNQRGRLHNHEIGMICVLALELMNLCCLHSTLSISLIQKSDYIFIQSQINLSFDHKQTTINNQ